MNIVKWIGWLAAAALVGMTAGCHHTQNPPGPIVHGERFVPDSDRRAVSDVKLAQAASGARQDATIYPYHFDGTGLNPLGRRKLDLMLTDETPTEPLTVYLDLPAGTPAAQHRQVVAQYLRDRGLQNSQIDLRDGPNPRNNASAMDAVTGARTLQVQAGSPNPAVQQGNAPTSSVPNSQGSSSYGGTR
ncbi:MAG TPA: hypothetical protein VLJ39_20630 [Tepidisphaeraceae bacterium]|jgi:hypothetical protein|nr:hypothetical protein [Tepidisphaeraceae bacterium]